MVWIKCSDRLPEESDWVLCFEKPGWFSLCEYEENKFVDPGWGIVNPTHWMKVEPPKE
jgi:Protein of unknown function (DUF551)